MMGFLAVGGTVNGFQPLTVFTKKKDFSYFRQETSSEMFDRVLNTPLAFQ